MSYNFLAEALSESEEKALKIAKAMIGVRSNRKFLIALVNFYLEHKGVMEIEE